MNVNATLTATDTPEEPLFEELSTANQLVKTGLGALMFTGWLLLFVCGMSLNSSAYRDLIFHEGVFNTKYLLLYAATFTPINVAILSALAGVLGGFASNLAASNEFHYRRSKPIDPESEEFNSYVYMTENPLVSMLRGFITYLIFIAGSYLTNFTTSVDPANNGNFIGLSASSYFKFAVSVSLLAYLAGYDPSRMKSLVNSVGFAKKDPATPTRGTVVTHQTTESLQVATTGVPPALNGQPAKTV
ncbi:hypothetical protein [Spirosoma utsteinense]|uniref:Uncharacterized protein n=1 Tax=Spirosoma utsteinense TaxID=2585773 RepID=A0ABR6W4B2_9BACT|nr:hypothetical protein [Spirosoma utsteinense]MBC3786371.1 hypothetical protein [Spirosoma utsteinense]MBC3791420.1 hypothetical protein [Spirosoma utsteinense]